MSSISNHLVRPHIRTLAGAAATFLLAIPTCAIPVAPPAKTITIGVDLPLTGDEGRAGLSTLNGIRYFVQQHPTLNGYTILLDARDDASNLPRDTSRGVKNVKAFIADRRVIAMLGPFDSSVARAQIPVANQAHMAMVSPATSSRCLTKEPYLPTKLNPSRTPVSCKDAGLPAPIEDVDNLLPEAQLAVGHPVDQFLHLAVDALRRVRHHHALKLAANLVGVEEVDGQA